jgi:ribosome biogenesis GTPase / thiamine phosphate phosphatase
MIDPNPTPSGPAPVDFASLERIGLNPALRHSVVQALMDDARITTDQGLRPLQPFRVIEVQRAQVLLHDGSHVHAARLLPELPRELDAANDAIAAGDWVLAAPDAQGDLWVHRRVPPINQIARRLHDGRDKVARAVIVANVDTALLTMGLDADFNLRRLDRYLALARLAAVDPLVILTKADLCRDVDDRVDAVRAMLPPLAQAIALNGLDAAATRATLLPWLQPGHTLVLLGSSGAGKSTLTNALLGEATQDTGPHARFARCPPRGLSVASGGRAPLTGPHARFARCPPGPARATSCPQGLSVASGGRAPLTGPVRDGDGRGRHTTTARTLYRLPGGACVIDTPGIRTLRLDTDEAGLQGAFGEMAALAARCRFRDCRHASEPGCAVRDAMAPDRLKSFQKLAREASRDSMTLLDRQRQHAMWRQRARASRALQKTRERP